MEENDKRLDGLIRWDRIDSTVTMCSTCAQGSAGTNDPCIIVWSNRRNDTSSNSTSAPRSGEARGGAIDSEKGNSSEKWTAF